MRKLDTVPSEADCCEVDMRVQLVEYMKHKHCVKQNLRQTVKKCRAILAQCVREADIYTPTIHHGAYDQKMSKDTFQWVL